jgi:transcriptional regulator with XRE-family HTH domain
VRLRPALQRTIIREQRRLGQRLRQIRQERGFTQERAAELAGIHPKHLSVVENGAVNVTFSTIAALAVAYKVALGSLFAESPTLR